MCIRDRTICGPKVLTAAVFDTCDDVWVLRARQIILYTFRGVLVSAHPTKYHSVFEMKELSQGPQFAANSDTNSKIYHQEELTHLQQHLEIEQKTSSGWHTH